MPKITQTPQEQPGNIAALVETQAVTLVHTMQPVVMLGVNRKINIGNFENIDVYAAVSLPLNASYDDVEDLKQAVIDAAEIGFAMTSQETGNRYTAIKELQKGGRPSK